MHIENGGYDKNKKVSVSEEIWIQIDRFVSRWAALLVCGISKAALKRITHIILLSHFILRLKLQAPTNQGLAIHLTVVIIRRVFLFVTIIQLLIPKMPPKYQDDAQTDS